MSQDQKRARTAEQKYFRRQQILDAAEAHLGEVGYEAFSMANLARMAGVVKGTLYLYFRTREEVFLTLYNQSLVRWSHVFYDRIEQDMTDLNYAAAFYSAATADPSFIPLLARLEHVIEHNVSIESLIESKRVFIQQVDRIAEVSAPALGLSYPQSQETVRTLGVLLMGATRADQGPSLQGEVIPPEIQAFVDSFSSEALFVKNAGRIINGIRSEGR